MYKVTNHQTIIKNPENPERLYIPQDPVNFDYQRFIQDVAEQGIEIVEGPDIIELDYVTLLSQEYQSLQEQADMQYWDQINGTTIWQDTITEIKEKYPKTITGGTTIGPVPDWVQEAADNWIFNKQLREYADAIENLPEYILENERPEVDTEEYEKYQHYLNIIDSTPEEVMATYSQALNS
jgi:hypothetical protein